MAEVEIIKIKVKKFVCPDCGHLIYDGGERGSLFMPQGVSAIGCPVCKKTYNFREVMKSGYYIVE